MCASICLRIDSTEACERRKRLVKCLVFAQQAEQQVLGLDIRRAKLAGLVSRKEDDAPCLLRVAFEHWDLPSTQAIGSSGRPFKLNPGGEIWFPITSAEYSA